VSSELCTDTERRTRMDVIFLVVLFGTTSLQLLGLWQPGSYYQLLDDYPELLRAIPTAHHLALFLLLAGMVKDRTGPVRRARIRDDYDD